MHINMKLDKALQLIKQFEGLKLKAYKCPAGVWTIGYGSTLIDGRPVQSTDFISLETAEKLLQQDVQKFADQIANIAKNCTQNEFNALVSFAYNIGLSALSKSTLLKLHNSGNKTAAANQFGRWTKAGGVQLPGLVARRAAERALYLAPDPLNYGRVPEEA
jgi:lysozyme